MQRTQTATCREWTKPTITCGKPSTRPGGYEGKQKAPATTRNSDQGKGGKDKMVEIIHVKAASMIWVDEYDVVREWDGNGHIIRQERINHRRYRAV